MQSGLKQPFEAEMGNRYKTGFLFFCFVTRVDTIGTIVSGGVRTLTVGVSGSLYCVLLIVGLGERCLRKSPYKGTTIL